MHDVGGMLGAGAFIVFDDQRDVAAVAEGVARFLAVESCGLCVPCKEDGLALADLFGRVRRSDAGDHELDAIGDRLRTVANGARCNLAMQYELVLESILEDFDDEIRAHLHGGAPAAGPELIASIVDLHGDRATIDRRQADKQPDWTYGGHWSGKSPADLLGAGGTATS